MALYLAMVGDVVVGAGDSATGATLDAMQRAADLNHDLEQAGGMHIEQVSDDQSYVVGSVLERLAKEDG